MAGFCELAIGLRAPKLAAGKGPDGYRIALALAGFNSDEIALIRTCGPGADGKLVKFDDIMDALHNLDAEPGRRLESSRDVVSRGRGYPAPGTHRQARDLYQREQPRR
jgi:hypothetical protein